MRLAATTLSTVVTLIVCELALRFIYPQQLINLRPDIWQPVAELGWQYAADLDTTINTGEGDVRLVTDFERNRRAPDWRSGGSEQEPHARVLALGDSFTTALQVDYEQTFTAILEKRLSGQTDGAIRITNTGVGGWGPSHYLIKAKQELARSDVTWDLIAVFFFLGNDVEDTRVASFEPRPTKMKRFGIPREFTMKEIRNRLLYPVNNVLEARSHLFTLAKNRGSFLLMRAGLSAHYFPPVLLTERKGDAGWALTADICAEIQAAAAANGNVPVLFFLIPGVYMVDPTVAEAYAAALGIPDDAYDIGQPATIMKRLLEERQLMVTDLSPLFRPELAQPLFGKVDTHLSPLGHQVVATGAETAMREFLER